MQHRLKRIGQIQAPQPEKRRPHLRRHHYQQADDGHHYNEAEGGIKLGGHRRKLKKSIPDRKSTRLNSSHLVISYAVFCLKKKKHVCDTPASTACRLQARTPPLVTRHG